MKKLILLLFLFIFGCDKIPTGVVDNKEKDFQIQATGLIAPKSVNYTNSDSLFTTSIKFNSVTGIIQVWADLFDSDNSKLNSSPIYLADNGNLANNGDTVKNDNVYSGRVPMSINFSNGQYVLQYYVKNSNNSVRNVAVHNFNYKSRFVNTSPVISNLIAPDTLTLSNQDIHFLMTLNVNDEDGLIDIKQVSFITYRPNGTTSGQINPMYDDGNINSHGDQVAGDGIYTFQGSLPPTTTPGTWKFVFHAADKSDSLSNTITHNILIK